jgi:hypothetical protein
LVTAIPDRQQTPPPTAPRQLPPSRPGAIGTSPSQLSAADLEQVRRRIDAAALLFKVRVMSDELRRREVPAAPDYPQPSIQKIS